MRNATSECPSPCRFIISAMSPRLKLTIAAGCLVALIPPLADHVMKAADGLGVRWGALASAAVLLGPSLTAMGMVTTTAVRSALTNSRATGRSVGLLYSVSTLGGLMGTLLAGFVLVPRWAAQNTLAGTAALLVLVGLAGRFIHRRNKALPSVAALALPVLAFGKPNTTIGENIRVLERSASMLGTLSVVQDDSRREPLRLLRADHSFIGGLWVNTGEPAFGFVHILEEVLKTIDPSAPVITDANNPLARLTLPVSEAFREAMNDLYPPSFWLR